MTCRLPRSPAPSRTTWPLFRRSWGSRWPCPTTEAAIPPWSSSFTWPARYAWGPSPPGSPGWYISIWGPESGAWGWSTTCWRPRICPSGTSAPPTWAAGRRRPRHLPGRAAWWTSPPVRSRRNAPFRCSAPWRRRRRSGSPSAPTPGAACPAGQRIGAPWWEWAWGACAPSSLSSDAW